MKIYLVGGAVRDHLMGLPLKEKDYVVVGAMPEQMIEKGFKPVGKDFPVFLHPQTKAEYALARTERKTGRGYTGFTFYAHPSVTLEEDLKRRDLTINAMALDEEKNQLIDPFNGKQDLEKRILRHVSDAFIEDPLRVLRVARFAARFGNLGFRIAEETKILLRKIVRQGELNDLVPERVWQEWQRALEEPSPQQFFLSLRECGALQVLFPEIDALFGVPQRTDFHPEIDTGIHIMMAIAFAAKTYQNSRVTFATLLHDVGKAKTPATDWPSHPGHEAAGKPIVDALCKRYKAPRNYHDLAALVAEFHLDIHRAFELKPTTMLNLFEKLDAFRRPERFHHFLEACEADFFGRPNVKEKQYEQKSFIENIFKKARAVVLADLEKLTGQQIKEKMRDARLKAIKSVLQEQKAI